VAEPLEVDRSTTGLISTGLSGNGVDRDAAQATGVDLMDENNHLAKVKVAGSNPVVRSKNSPGQSAASGQNRPLVGAPGSEAHEPDTQVQAYL
jgi:hypothetical protein